MNTDLMPTIPDAAPLLKVGIVALFIDDATRHGYAANRAGYPSPTLNSQTVCSVRWGNRRR